MRKYTLVGLMLAAVTLSVPASGQTGEFPPYIFDIEFEIAHYIGGRDYLNYQASSIFGLYGLYSGLWADPVPFDPFTEVAQELDVVLVSLVLVDQDLADAENQSDMEFFRYVRGWGSYGPPDAPPLYGATDGYISSGVSPPLAPPPENAVRMEFVLQVPEYNGANQSRLRGLIDYDVFWEVEVRVSNSESPEAGQWDGASFPLFAVENASLVPPNPPAFADAGQDQLVAAGTTVTLDASRSFDSTNLGFDQDDANVFEKDTLVYTWEWISGPERVDPVPAASNEASQAEVTLEEPGEYVYRVAVEDGVNPVPSLDSVTITVVAELRENRGPSAIISDDEGNVVTLKTVSAKVGDRIYLSAALSSDPDNDELTYLWRQTNEVGGALMTDEVLNDFQPLLGINSIAVSWVAQTEGTYYFALLVTDKPPLGLSPLSATASVTIDVGPASAGAQAARQSDLSDSAADDTGDVVAPAGCGGSSLLPLAVVPLALYCMRRRP